MQKIIIKATASEIVLKVTQNENRWAGTPESEINAMYDEIEETGRYFDVKTGIKYILSA